MKKSFLFVVILAITSFGFVGCESEELAVSTTNYFSVSETSRVAFSTGNLQYQASTKTWRFAEHQYDQIGNGNANISDSYDGWIDLFGWGTGNKPTKTSVDHVDYPDFDDWGKNKIAGDKKHTWRTLSHDEWDYLLHKRLGANMLAGIAKVEGINGLLLLPDKYWVCVDSLTHGIIVDGVRFNTGAYDSNDQARRQVFSMNEWLVLEAGGAVFLPQTNYRMGNDVYYKQDYGVYWTATATRSNSANYLYFYSDKAYLGENLRIGGLSVRLVKDL